MAEQVRLLNSEKAALKELKSRLVAIGRASTLVLAGHGSKESRLGVILRTLTNDLGGQYYDLTTPEVLERLKNGPPLYGRSIGNRLSNTVLRQFLLREVSTLSVPVLAVHIPSTIWRIMAATHPDEPRRFLRGLSEWTSPCGLVLSYPFGADPSLPLPDETTDLLVHHLVKLMLTDAEHRYLEDKWEGTVHDQQ